MGNLFTKPTEQKPGATNKEENKKSLGIWGIFKIVGKAILAGLGFVGGLVAIGVGQIWAGVGLIGASVYGIVETFRSAVNEQNEGEKIEQADLMAKALEEANERIVEINKAKAESELALAKEHAEAERQRGLGQELRQERKDLKKIITEQNHMYVAINVRLNALEDNKNEKPKEEDEINQKQNIKNNVVKINVTPNIDIQKNNTPNDTNQSLKPQSKVIEINSVIPISPVDFNCGLYALVCAANLALKQNPNRQHSFPLSLTTIDGIIRIDKQTLAPGTQSLAVMKKFGENLRKNYLKPALLSDNEFQQDWQNELTQACMMKLEKAESNELDIAVSESTIASSIDLLKHLNDVKAEIARYIETKKIENDLTREYESESWWSPSNDQEKFRQHLQLFLNRPDLCNKDMFEDEAFAIYKNKSYKLRKFCHYFKEVWDTVDLNKIAPEIREMVGIVKETYLNFIKDEMMKGIVPKSIDDGINWGQLYSLMRFVPVATHVGLLGKEEIEISMLRLYCILAVKKFGNTLFKNYAEYVSNNQDASKKSVMLTAKELSCLAKRWKLSLTIISPNEGKMQAGCVSDQALCITLINKTQTNEIANHWEVVLTEEVRRGSIFNKFNPTLFPASSAKEPNAAIPDPKGNIKKQC